MREARIDLDAVRSNVAVLRAIAGVASMVIVKANGYGHGAVPVARAAVEAGTEWLGVADITEALELRAAGIDAPILAWLHEPGLDFSAAVAAGIDIGVSYPQQLDAVAAASGRANVQLKVDTGLGRNGADESQWLELIAAAAAHERAGRVRVRGIWSHLANAGEAADAAQIAAFEAAVEAARAAGLEPDLLHLAATEGALYVPAARFDLVRLGIGVYGLPPNDRPVANLRAAMQLSASVVAVKRVPSGHGVSYGHDHVADRATTLALVPVGYADGIPRSASGRAQVAIGGVRHPVVGRIAMDQVVVDVGNHVVSVGDRAVVFGDGSDGSPTATDWAHWSGTINYEIVTRIGPRVARRYAW